MIKVRVSTAKVVVLVRESACCGGAGTLLEQWQVLQAAIEADCIVIMQAANTGLTGGSTPYGDDYDRPVLVMSTRRLKGIQVIHDGKQVICLRVRP